MAKRHAGLIRLSRDHHEGLLLGVRLQQGVNAVLEQWSHDPLVQSKMVTEFFDAHLVRHFRAEEEHLFPVARVRVPESVPLVDRLISDHRALAARAEDFRTPVPAGLPGRLMEFGSILEAHIRAEDRELFPLLEQQLPTDMLTTIGTMIDGLYPGIV